MQEKSEMADLRRHNQKILFNLLPAHVAMHFLDNQFLSNMVSFDCNSVTVLFTVFLLRNAVLFCLYCNYFMNTISQFTMLYEA